MSGPNFFINLPPGKESPDRFNECRANRGFGDYFGFPADCDLGRAYVHYKDGEDEYDLANRLYNEGVFDGYWPEPDEYSFEAINDYCIETAFELYYCLEMIIDEVKNIWRPERAKAIIPKLPKLNRATT